MNIKGFDRNLCCRGFRFEIGKTYDTGADENDLEICTNTVFHYCKSLKDVHNYYDCKDKNRYCEIEVLGKEIQDGEKFGSNKIKIVREIIGEELDQLKGLTNGNTGLFNSGDYNSGDYNIGNRNSGYCNSGNSNSGYYNSGNRNSGDYNSGDYNSGNYNSGNYNSGNYNSGNYNSGNYNSGYCNSGNSNSGYYNSGYCNSGNSNSGNRNSGDYNSGDYNIGNRNSGNGNSGNRNSGDYNSGNYNSGNFNSCNCSSGFFCNQEPKAIVFNKETSMTVSGFVNSKYYNAICSSTFPLTKWIDYTQSEKDADKSKALTGGYLKTLTYKESCAEWWKIMSGKNKEIIKSIPNFDAKVFEDITGIKL